MRDDRIEVCTKGTWLEVPALDIQGTKIIIKGKWIKFAIVHDEAWLESELQDPELYLQTLRCQGVGGRRADVFTFAQKLPTVIPKYTYSREWDSVATIRLVDFKDWWERLPQETRKNVRRSQRRGVKVDVHQFDEELIRGISDINNDSPVRQGEMNIYYRRSFEQVRKDYSSFMDRCDFIVAYFGSEMIGFLKIVYRGKIASILNLTPKASHSDKRPANALIAKAIEICEARGITHVTYGLFNYGNKRNNPLREFKVRNGFQEMLTPRFYIPLTFWGEIVIKLKLHRGLMGILPHAVITWGVNARKKWYDLMKLTSRCSSTPERPNRNRQMERSNPPAGSNSYRVSSASESEN